MCKRTSGHKAGRVICFFYLHIRATTSWLKPRVYILGAVAFSFDADTCVNLNIPHTTESVHAERATAAHRQAIERRQRVELESSVHQPSLVFLLVLLLATSLSSACARFDSRVADAWHNPTYMTV